MVATTDDEEDEDRMDRPVRSPPVPSLPQDLTLLRSAAEDLASAGTGSPEVRLAALLEKGTREHSDMVRYVRLAAAKIVYEQLHPDAAHGKASAKKDSDPSFRDYAAKMTGWKPDTIQKWCAIGDKITIGAYVRLQGTSMANRTGALKRLAAIPKPAQLEVADIAKASAAKSESMAKAYRKLEYHFEGTVPTVNEDPRTETLDPNLDADYYAWLGNENGAECAHCHGSGKQIERCVFPGCTFHERAPSLPGIGGVDED